MGISRLYTFVDGVVPTAAQINGEFNNIINNALSLISPLTGALSMGGNSLIFDAAGVSKITSPATTGFTITPGAKSGTPGATGMVANVVTSTCTDSNTAASGTAALWTGTSFQAPTLKATNTSVVTTDAATLYVAGAPIASTNETITNGWAAYINGNSKVAGNLTVTGTIGSSVTGHGAIRGVVTNTTTLTFTPYGGNGIIIAGTHYSIPSAGLTLANTGLTAATLYYIYIYNNSGTLTLEASTTTHVTDSTAGNIGVEIKSGDNSRTLVGMAYMGAGTPGTFVSSATQRYFRNWFNRSSDLKLSTASVSGNTASTVYVTVGVSPLLNVLAWANEIVQWAASGTVYNSTANDRVFVGMSVAASGVLAANTSECSNRANAINGDLPFSVSGSNAAPSEGLQSYDMIMKVPDGGTGTFNNTNYAQLWVQ